jgi:hypothetical protein
VLPIGYSFNLDGSMMYCTFATVFIAPAYGIEMSLGSQLYHDAGADADVERHGRRAACVAGGDCRDADPVQHPGSGPAAAGHRPLPRHGASSPSGRANWRSRYRKTGRRPNCRKAAASASTGGFPAMEGLFFISLTFDLDHVRAWKFVM